MAASANPHLNVEPVLAGVALEQAGMIGVLVHGRDQDHEVMLDVVERMALPGVGYVLPVATGRSWYPGRYFDPVEDNQPDVDWALEAIEAGLSVARAAGVPGERIVLGGFSQGACMVAELVARRPPRLAGVAVLTGCLLGPEGGHVTPARVDELPMYFGSSRHDEWIAIQDALATARAFATAGARVALEAYEDRVHEVSDRAVAGLRGLFSSSAGSTIEPQAR
ncbi:MAG: dienelactone hydrolase family protein [Solirubrobacteraceae bacterium]